MINLLASLVDRTLGRAPILQRRQPGLFEPVNDAVLTLRNDDAGSSLREDEMFAESERAEPQSPLAEVTKAVIPKPRLSSREKPSSAAATLVPQAIDVSAAEAKPQLEPSHTNSTARVDHLDASTVSEESQLRDVTDQPPLNRAKTADYEPSIETIVETKLERETVLLNPSDQNPLEQTDLFAQPSKNSERLTADDVTARRPDPRKQTPPQLDRTAWNKLPIRRRETRQETQRAMRFGVQPEAPQRGPSTPTINVTIGRVEVRATTPTKRAESARPASPKLSLEDYLQGRSKGN